MNQRSPWILILEDTESISTMVSEALRASFPSATVVVAGSLVQGRALAREHTFDLMILDVQLPDGNGPEFLMEIQQNNPEIKAIFLTSSPLPMHQEQARALGAIAFLRKPARLTRIRQVVGEILESAREIETELCFRGILSRLTPLDLAQLKCLSGSTLALEFDQPGTGTGRVYFENGQIVHAEAGPLSGEAAFCVIAGWKHGSVTEIADLTIVTRTIDIPWASLLMNAAQQKDESSASAEKPRVVADSTKSTIPVADSGSETSPQSRGPDALTAVKVLVAEDDAVIAKLIEFKLQQKGFTVISAQDGENALALVRSERPSLVILDVMMPVINGFQVLQEIKQSEELRSIPVIFLTSKGRDADIERGLGMGAADYMVKPFSPNELMARVKKALREVSTHP